MAKIKSPDSSKNHMRKPRKKKDRAYILNAKQVLVRMLNTIKSLINLRVDKKDI